MSSLVLQADGRILLAGLFRTVGGVVRTNLARINADGSLDSSFDARVQRPTFPLSGAVEGLALQADGSLLVGGSFIRLAGQARTNLARLSNDAANQDLSCDGARITWLRGGAAPEIQRATFDFSTNGLTWSSLPAGARISGGWQVIAGSLPANALIRARGFLSAGYSCGSSWFVETRLTPPDFLAVLPEAACSGRFGCHVVAAAGKVVVVEGSTDLFHWIPLQTNTVSADGSFYFTDALAPDAGARFYRARAQ